MLQIQIHAIRNLKADMEFRRNACPWVENMYDEPFEL
jgi:hypothetical protein